MRRLLLPHRVRWLGRSHGITDRAIAVQLLILEQQRSPGPTEVPFHVVRQDTDQDMRTHPRLQPVMDRPHQQVDPLQAPERLLHQRQPLVRPHAVGGRQTIGRLDWYAKGRDFIVSTQRPDGSWNGDFGAEMNTVWAMLFLTK